MKYSKALHIIAAVAVSDRILKHLVVSGMIPGQSIRVLPFLSITYLRNTGMAFSMFTGNNFLLLLINIFVASAIALFLFRKGGSKYENTAYALVLGGAFSNMLDRALFGGVIDYIDIGFWPVFNIADAAISAGAVILALSITGIRIGKKRDVS